MDAMTALSNAEVMEEPRVGRAAVRGALLGFVLVAIGSTWMAYAGSADFGGAIGVGVFVGIWGGCGSGGMMGATMCLTRAEAREAAQSGEQAVTPTAGSAPGPGVGATEPEELASPRSLTARSRSARPDQQSVA